MCITILQWQNNKYCNVSDIEIKSKQMNACFIFISTRTHLQISTMRDGTSNAAQAVPIERAKCESLSKTATEYTRTHKLAVGGIEGNRKLAESEIDRAWQKLKSLILVNIIIICVFT